MNKLSKKKPVLPSQTPTKKLPAQPGLEKQCASCSGNNFRSSCVFRNAKCHRCGKAGHIQKVCRTAVFQSTLSADSAVVTLSLTQEVKDILPKLQLVNLPSFSRQLHLVLIQLLQLHLSMPKHGVIWKNLISSQQREC